MKLIRNYLLRRFSAATVFVLVSLLGLYGFFDAIQQLPSLGKGNYHAGTLVTYVLLQAPGHAYELMPLAVLIGAMVAMSQLAGSSEYTAIRTSGVSLRDIASTKLLFGGVIAIIALLLGEFGAPYAEQQAERIKLHATHSLVAQEFRSGLWVKDDNNIINIGEMLPDNTLLGVRIQTYDQNYRLTRVRYAERAQYLPDSQEWRLQNVRQSDLAADSVKVGRIAEMNWHSILQPELLSVLLVVPEQMSALDLMTYIEHLRNNSQKTQRYEIALWSKLFYPLACISMAMVALAFTPLNGRHNDLGIKLFAGICIGIAFHFSNRLFGHMGLLYNWNPIISATLPTLLFLAAGVAAISRQERR
ncbi:LPS export ABC transporter permease LptG [Vogesella facilis]|uniref:LPS export ABC transporter permease LptG n=1 Tax=Vogesella facilis TaxID=1655232 RepID=A0ABV7REV3_9NEIS